MVAYSLFRARLLFIALFVGFIGFVPCKDAQAATYTWQAGVVGEWNDSSRWSGGPAGTVPGASDTAVITSGQVRLQNNVTVANLNWSGGRISDFTGNTTTARLFVTTTLNISGTDTKYMALDSDSGNFAIENQGTATWTGTGGIGTSKFSNSTGKIEFYNTGTFNIQNDAFFSADFINSGTLTKQNGVGGTSNSNFSSFYNLGTAKSQSGVLSLSSGDIGSGSIYDASAGATIALSGTHLISNGIATFSGAGRISLGSSGTLTIPANTAIKVSGTLESFGTINDVGLLDVNGVLDWMGGAMKNGVTVIEATGKLNIKGNGSLSEGRLVNNSGTATWTNGFISVSGGATFNNKSGGKFNCQLTTGSNFGNDDAASSFNNEAGATVSISDSGQPSFVIPFNNNGTVSVQTGGVIFKSGGTSTGTFNTTVGTFTDFEATLNPKSYTHNSGTKFTGLGGVSVSDSGIVNIATGATVNCDSAYRVLEFSSLKINFGAVFKATSNFSLQGGTVDGLGTLNVTGRLDWNDGDMKGTGSTDIAAGGQLVMQGTDSNSALNLDTRTLNNSGTTTIIGNSSFADFLRISNNAVFNNKTGGVVNIQHDGYFINQNSTGGTFDNQAGATLNCNAIGSDFLQGGGIDVLFLNNGTVNVQQGTLILTGGGQSSGKFNVATNATLDINSVLYTANAGTTLTGGGMTWVETTLLIPSGANLIVPAGHTMRLASAIDGSGQLTINGTLDWQQGVMQGGGITRINAGGTSTWTAGEFDQSKDLTNRTFSNFGTTIWSGDNMNVGAGAAINNESGATFIDSTDRSMFALNSTEQIFNNKVGATFTKNTTTSTQIWQVPFTNAGSVILQSGTLNFQYFTGNYVQTIGFTNLLGGNLSSLQFSGNKSTIDIQGGIVTGTGTINANLTNNGQIKPGQTAGVPGVLTISGDYTQTANGKLDIEIGGITAGTQYDQLQIGGAANIDGLLTIVHINNFVPSLSDTFQVMTYASRAGSFSLSGTDYGVLLLKPLYNATNLTLVTKQRTIGIDNEAVLEGTSAAVTAQFTVFLSDASGQSVTVDYTTANGSATAPADYVAATGTVTFSPGQVSKTISVAVQGDALDEDDEKFFVNLSNPSGAVFEDAQAECTIIDNDPTPSLSIRDLSMAEGASGFSNAAFSVVLSAASGKDVKVDFASIDGSALAPDDYTAVSGTLIIPAGATIGTINVPIKGDLLDEPNETFRVNLSNPINATIADNQALGTIRDDDPTPALSINSVTVPEGNSGTVNAAFTITLSAPSGQTVSVSAIPSDGTARAPGDYTTGGVRLTFTPGQTTKTFIVPVKGDLLDETDENFFVILSSPVNAGIGVGRGTGTINDDDAPPSISIDDLQIGEGNSGQRIAALRLKLSAPSGQVVRVNAATANGTAIAGTTGDYVALPSTQISFTAGNVFAYARVTINGDELTEANETFLVNLSSPINATISDTQGICTILNDDAAPSLTINDVSIAEGNAGTKNLSFTLTLSKASGQAVSVKFASADGTAKAGSDYVAQSGTLTFAAGGALTQKINIVINGDAVLENDETFVVLLSAATNASISKARGVGTITNDDSSA